MECGICSKTISSRRQPTCPSCARASIYQSRVDQLTAILDKERLHKQVTTVISSSADLLTLPAEEQTVELTEGAKKLEAEQWKSQLESVDQRLEIIRAQQELLRQQINEAREQNTTRQVEHKRQRAAIQKKRLDLDKIKPQLVEPLKTEIRRLDHRLAKVQMRTTDGRVRLLRETARLAGLDQRKKSRNGTIKEEYLLGGLPMVDLRDLNGRQSIRLSSIHSLTPLQLHIPRSLQHPLRTCADC